MANLTLVKTESERVREALNYMVEEELADFAIQLQMARTVWRKHRDMVEAPKFPEYLRAPFIAHHESDPDQDDSGYAESDPELARQKMLPRARKVTRG